MDFIKIIERLCNNEPIGQAELDGLLKWLSSPEGKGKLGGEIIQKWNDFSNDKQSDHSDILREIHALQGKQKIIKRKRRLRVQRWIAAAVVLPLIAATGIFLYLGQAPETTAIARIVEDVMLVMPDGSEIILDRSTENSRLAEQDNIVFARDGGKLIAEKQNDGATPAELKWGKVEVPKGAQFDMVLEDGTQVWLNAGSYLRFPIAFAGGERRVFLEGEAFFTVTENKDRPFIVETAEQTLAVLGTEFNVYAYPNESKVQTTLLSGSVGVTAKGTNEQKILIPGQQLQLDKTTNLFSVRTVSAADESAWRNELFVFDKNTLGQVFAKLARWYDLEYTFDDIAAADLILRGNIPMFDDISVILKIIESSDEVVIKRNGNALRIKMKK